MSRHNSQTADADYFLLLYATFVLCGNVYKCIYTQIPTQLLAKAAKKNR